MTETRKVLLYAPNRRTAEEWSVALGSFYKNSTRVSANSFQSSFPMRIRCDTQIYTVTKDYYSAVALAMLGAQKEILITSWKNSPTVLLCRPPLPPLRLDQVWLCGSSVAYVIQAYTCHNRLHMSYLCPKIWEYGGLEPKTWRPEKGSPEVSLRVYGGFVRHLQR
jgi:hypothetical protein